VPWRHDRKIGIIPSMSAGEGVSAARDSLIWREAAAIVESLGRSHPRELRDNLDGVGLLEDAVRDAIRLGLDAGCEHAGRAVGEPRRPAPRWRVR
jgi:hypothetical protein